MSGNPLALYFKNPNGKVTNVMKIAKKRQSKKNRNGESTSKKRSSPLGKKVPKIKTTKKNKEKFDFASWNPKPFLKLPNKDCYFEKTDNYLVFSPYGENATCDIVGIDIGTVHLGMVGLAWDEDINNYKVTWIALLSYRAKTAVQSCDMFDEILTTNKDFQFFRDATQIAIEGQRQLNVIPAATIRATARTIAHLVGREPDVENVNGDNKYKIAPLYSEEAASNPNRWHTGAKGRKYRKLVGEQDTLCLLKLDNDIVVYNFLMSLKNGKDFSAIDQLHDVADGYLIARWKAEHNKDPKFTKSKKYKQMLEHRKQQKELNK